MIKDIDNFLKSKKITADTKITLALLIELLDLWEKESPAPVQQEGVKRFPGEGDIQFKMRKDKYEFAKNCDCERCKEIVNVYASTPPASSMGSGEEINAIKQTIEAIKHNCDKINNHTWQTYKEQILLEIRIAERILSQSHPLQEARRDVPTDEQVKDWYSGNIDADCSASSAIYKFRLWLKSIGSSTVVQVEEKECIACGHKLPIEYFDNGTEKCYLCYVPAPVEEWIKVEDELPELIKGQDYSENVWVICDGVLAIMCIFFIREDDGYLGWANCYGKFNGEGEYDDQYNVTHWKKINPPQPPNTN